MTATSQRQVPEHTGSTGTRMLGAVTLAGVLVFLLLALVISPPEVDQGEAVRLLYLHVPAAVLTYVAFFTTAFASAMWLWKRSTGWDLLAVASAEIGVIFCGLTLVIGMLWGEPIWGTWWTWDARLTTTALLFLLYVGYLVVRRLPIEADRRRRYAAWVGLLAVVDIPIVHYSVEWWRGLHQGRTLDPIDTKIDDLMLFTLLFGFVVFALVFVWLLGHRFRLAWLEDRVERRLDDDLLDERRAEARAPDVADAVTTVTSTGAST
ncbi:MAG: cytochrome c biogenesis protein CcsA [Acidimicrobiales bacterium]